MPIMGAGQAAASLDGSAVNPHYGRVAIWLHWLIGVAMLAEIAFGFLLDDIAPRGTPARGGVINLHKSAGVVLVLLVAFRLAWRLAHVPPAWPRHMPRWKQSAAISVHRALYASMIVSPLAGYAASNFSRHGVRFFGLLLPPWGPDLPRVYAFLNGLHVATSWLLALLVTVHVAAALKHGVIDRDGIFQRIRSRPHPGATSRAPAGNP